MSLKKYLMSKGNKKEADELDVVEKQMKDEEKKAKKTGDYSKLEECPKKK